ncbi:hypothetical protein XYCOK13_06570 [Xylanibacillus composti]|uniref:Uncharacterized protein n=1 Tax=Xylanibacillus composti TaxID=1572762 RepID=A0A8J4H3C4_9BACL|nr:hypothetical protein XYCOK13_06570 [Xylanibacillus composti]
MEAVRGPAAKLADRAGTGSSGFVTGNMTIERDHSIGGSCGQLSCAECERALYGWGLAA